MKSVKRATVVAFVCIFSVNMKTIMKEFILFNLRIFYRLFMDNVNIPDDIAWSMWIIRKE